MLIEQFTTQARFEELIARYGWLSRYQLAKAIVEIKCEKDRCNYSNETEFNELKQIRTQQYNRNLGAYLKGERTPSRKTLKLWSQTIGCAFQELNQIFNPEGHLLYPLLNNFFEYPQQPLLTEYTFRSLEVQCFIMYSREGHLKRLNRHKLECLQDRIGQFDKFSYYKRTGEKLIIDSPDQRFQIFKQEDSRRNESYTGLKFDEPMRKGQVMDFFLNFSYAGIYEEDDTFHTISIMRPTNLIDLRCTPPSPRECRQATLYEFKNQTEYLQGNGKVMGTIPLDEASNSFNLQIKNPPVGASFKIYWGR
jgi:hypothetical protein